MQNACYLKYLAHCQKTIKCNPKMLWSYVNSKRKCNTGYPGIMTLDDKQLTGSDDICAAFNCYFKSMFARPTCSSSVAGQAYTGVDSNNFAGTFSVTQKTVFKMLSKVDIKKGVGGDLIPPFFVLKCAGPLSIPLCIIFNRSVSEGVFPAKWKEASIVPLHKKGTKCKIENYRPISILNVFAKCLERVVYDEVYPMIIKGIPEEQHGCVKGRSTTSNLSLFVSDVHRGMGFQSQVDVIYTDFEKAFDRVDHIILLQKLQQLGIHGDLYRWVKSYILNRKQAVVIGGNRSDFVSIPSGVPQGSLLGPLFYIAYISDIGLCFRHAQHLLYADDTKIYMKVNTIEDCMKLQEDLDRLSLYYLTNRITVNVAKCAHIQFTRRKNPIDYNFKLNNVSLNKVYSVKDLGVYLDSKLTFNSHFEYIVNKAYKNLGFIIRVTRDFTDISCIKVLYYAYIRSILEYCSTVWNPQYVTHEHSLERLQIKFVKYLNFKSKLKIDGYTESCQKHSLITLAERREMQDMAVFHDICSGKLDCVELSYRILNLNAPGKRTRHTHLFHIPLERTNYAANDMSIRLPKTYNKFYSDIDIFTTSKTMFKAAVHKLKLS